MKTFEIHTENDGIITITTGSDIKSVTFSTQDGAGEKKAIDAWNSDKYIKPFNAAQSIDSLVEYFGNKTALAASMAMLGTENSPYSSLFVCGGTGLGKSHLLNAISGYTNDNFADFKVCFTSGNLVRDALVKALSTKNMEKFRSFFRALDVLLIDDFQFVCGRSSLQEELLHTFQYLRDSNKVIVIASSSPFAKLIDIHENLKSFLSGGLNIEILPPDESTKAVILQNFADSINFKVDADVIQVLSACNCNDIRTLKGILISLEARHKYCNVTVTASMAIQILKELETR